MKPEKKMILARIVIVLMFCVGLVAAIIFLSQGKYLIVSSNDLPQAIHEDNLKLARRIIKGDNINEIFIDDNKLIIELAIYDAKTIMKYALENGLKADERALYAAAIRGYDEIVEMLVQQGVIPNPELKQKMLDDLQKYDQKEVLDFLIKENIYSEHETQNIRNKANIKNSIGEFEKNDGWETYKNNGWNIKAHYPTEYSLLATTAPQASLDSGWPGHLSLNWMKNEKETILNLEITLGEDYKNMYRYGFGCFQEGPFEVFVGEIKAEKYVHKKGGTQGSCDELNKNPRDSLTKIFLTNKGFIYYFVYLSKFEEKVNEIISGISFIH